MAKALRLACVDKRAHHHLPFFGDFPPFPFAQRALPANATCFVTRSLKQIVSTPFSRLVALACPGLCAAVSLFVVAEIGGMNGQHS